MATTSKAFRQLTDQNAVGTLFGASTSDLIGFYGVSSTSAQLQVTGSVSSGAAASSAIFQLFVLGILGSTNIAP
jgi:hypothetical protein